MYLKWMDVINTFMSGREIILTNGMFANYRKIIRTCVCN